MKATFLVPTLGNRKVEIVRLLNSLQNQSYKNFEVIFISQDNHESLEELIGMYTSIDIKQLKSYEKGISVARNVGLKVAQGDIIVLSDDDCWYPIDAMKDIVDIFSKERSAKIILTQIFDKENNVMYKNYPNDKKYINYKLQLMSKSSIEIAYKRKEMVHNNFDERFGIGAEFICGEEVDFLLRNLSRNAIFYSPTVTVYHAQKTKRGSKKQIIAKGALYRKNYIFLICLVVLVRDLLKKGEVNFKLFFKGYCEYAKKRY